MKAWRTLRRRVMTPDISETRCDVRGFHVTDEATRVRLETVGSSFLTGFGEAAQARVAADVQTPLDRLAPTWRGFAYEGAAMALAIRDALPGSGRRVADFLAGPGDPHVYMAYVGVGWAMARLPRFRWSRLYAPDPLLRWLVLDGYGFHQAYFHTRRYVDQRYREETFPWPGDDPGGYAVRAIDQGIGRASWFVVGADPDRLARLFAGFAEPRRPDLWAGAGLAATYAGGADEAGLRRLRESAGPYRGDLAQGSAFAAGARVRAGLVVPHNQTATQVLCGLSTEAASAVTDETRTGVGPADGMPAYEVWRQRIRNVLVAAASN
ncbi:DUF1702 family protein [Micromonospora radicis]|uniref:DUF1702 family protein n=1 Tax=Micromonospora radicis TaxID=1894971 RepID=A0A418MYH6_9ACTN|nr:DUF1702 family protein [Micromonospora radicis]RIV40262.1 DUF1702 family protein [Micromonospora radicis]